jgi:catechol 2,3-dioxygenase-like lactoylglutathione lyase family enzyme
MLGEMTIQRMDNVAIVVDDLDAAVAFFTELGMELEGKAQIEGLFADRTVGLDGVPERHRDDADPGWPQQAGADQIPHPRGGRRRAGKPATQHTGPASCHVRRRRHP